MGRSMINENNEVVFSYQVNTIMPITGLSCGNLMVPSTAKLTKEDVLICLKKAPVFRRYTNRKLERVTISNLDRLHNEEYMTKEEYEAFLEKQGDNRGKVVVEVPVVEEKKETQPVQDVKETVTPEPKEEAETVAQTETIVEEVTDNNVNDEEVSENVTETPVDVVEETEENSDNNNQKYRYNNKKKHNPQKA